MIFKAIINKPILSLFSLIVFVGFCFIPFFGFKDIFYPEQVLPLYFMQNLFHGSSIYHFTLGFLFQLFNSLILLSIANELKLLSKNKFSIPLVYLLLSTVFFQSFYFNPIHLSSFILLISLKIMLRLQVKQRVDFDLLLLSILSSLSGMVYPPFYLFSVAAFLSIIIIRPFRLRELVIYIIGLILPVVYYFGILYLVDQMSQIPFPLQWEYSLNFNGSAILLTKILSWLVLAIVLFSIFFLFVNSTKMVVRNRVFFNVWMLFLAFAGLLYFLPYTNSFSTYLLCIPFFTLLICYYLTSSTRTWHIEILLIIIGIASFMANISV